MRLAQKAFDDPSIGERHRADAQWRWDQRHDELRCAVNRYQFTLPKKRAAALNLPSIG
jgi:hypothetical protein